MSNKVVPPIYRAVIDDVIAAIRPSFEDLGVADDVLHELQQKWEEKVIASRVADFDPAQPAPPAHHPYPVALPQYAVGGITYIPPSAAQPRPGVKPEPVDPRYALAAPQYALPPLPGPSLGSLGGLAFPASMYRLPQTDGPAGSEDDDDEDDEDASPAPRMPRTAHPSLQPSASAKGAEPTDEEAINSDLDDSDTENEEDPEDAAPETDIVFCTYDKVARVKNKWKCVLKDGMIHTGGKDYLFQRCTGEFEW
ncbi:transcription factor IIA alpha/beta subunit [Mycena alexandri]|uniref:Transcription factor IIA alpha/beta subunit n=1 Tax=Mycena alexandri TaxID=1745969 RepID=A0AAD6S2P7_9AGAR|nr:transcription factor IIA alpha/beta subunit [Mycena alexandri]